MEWIYDDAGFRIAETTPRGEEIPLGRRDDGVRDQRARQPADALRPRPGSFAGRDRAGNTRTWLTDALKTPVKRLTETGTTYSVTRYDEYGEVEEETSPDIPRFGFTGHQRGPAEAPDLYYAQQRWYNAATGRFISEDPVWGEPKRPLSLHRYLYAYANPTVFVDPDGRMGLPNSWSEMPGYEAPEPCELCYMDGSPNSSKRFGKANTGAARSLCSPHCDDDSRIGRIHFGLEERVGQANSALDAVWAVFVSGAA